MVGVVVDLKESGKVNVEFRTELRWFVEPPGETWEPTNWGGVAPAHAPQGLWQARWIRVEKDRLMIAG